MKKYTYREAEELRRQAESLLNEKYHQEHGTSKLEKENCGTCCLKGYNAFLEKGAWHINYAGWERVYVQSSTPISLKYVEAFRLVLTDYDNVHYAEALKDDIAYFGVKIEK